MVEVVAALIRNEGKLLICRRPPEKARGMLWEFAGGKVEVGETKEQALVRECREELDLTVKVGTLFADTVYEYPDLTVHVSFFTVSAVNGIPKRKEHAALRWVLPEELSEYPFCPADLPVLEQIRLRYGSGARTAEGNTSEAADTVRQGSHP